MNRVATRLIRGTVSASQDPDTDTGGAGAFLLFACILIWGVAVAAKASGLPVPTYMLCLVSIGLLLVEMSRRMGFLDYRTLLVFSGSFYAFVGTTDILFGNNALLFSRDIGALNTLVATTFLMVFGLVSLSGNAKAEAASIRQGERVPIAPILVLVSAMMVPYLFYVLSISQTASSRVEVLAGSSVGYAAVLFAVFTGLLVIISELRQDIFQVFSFRTPPQPGPAPRVLAVILVAILVLILAVTQLIVLGNRREIMSFLVAAAVAAGMRRLPLWMFPVGGVLIWFSTVLPWLRQAPITEWMDIIVNFSTYFGTLDVSNTEHYAFAIVADTYYSAPTTSHAPSMLDAFGTLVPQNIWPNRPMPAGEWFVATYYPELYRIGGGLAYNLPMETVINLGFFGPIIIPALIALFAARLGTRPNSALVWRAAIVLAWLFWLRYDFATLLKSLVLVFPFVFAWLLIQRSVITIVRRG